MTNYEPRSIVQTVMIDRLVAYKSVTEVRDKIERTYFKFKIFLRLNSSTFLSPMKVALL